MRKSRKLLRMLDVVVERGCSVELEICDRRRRRENFASYLFLESRNAAAVKTETFLTSLRLLFCAVSAKIGNYGCQSYESAAHPSVLRIGSLHSSMPRPRPSTSECQILTMDFVAYIFTDGKHFYRASVQGVAQETERN